MEFFLPQWNDFYTLYQWLWHFRIKTINFKQYQVSKKGVSTISTEYFLRNRHVANHFLRMVWPLNTLRKACAAEYICHSQRFALYVKVFNKNEFFYKLNFETNWLNCFHFRRVKYSHSNSFQMKTTWYPNPMEYVKSWTLQTLQVQIIHFLSMV